MAIEGKRADSKSRVAMGTYTLNGDPRTTLTISRKLDGYDFPNEPGTDVRVELIEREKKPDKLEVVPVQEGTDVRE